MNAQHTPGPWKSTGLAVYAEPENKWFGAGPSRKYERIICSADDNGLLDSDEANYRHRVNGIQGNNVRFPGYSEAQANARLIAAAPELLGALEGLLQDFDATDSPDGSQSVCRWCGRVFDMGQDNCDSDDCTGVKARCSIAKARGQA